MSTSRSILVALIGASPAILLGDGLIMQGVLCGIIAVALAITALTLRPGETVFFVSVTRHFAAVAAVPALWIVFQILPLRPLAHPIWASAQSALGHSVWASISVDPGASVIALGQYLVLCAAGFVSAAVGVDRGRAEALLFALTAAAVMIALIVLTHDLFFPSLSFSPITREQAVECVAMGAIIASAACIRTFERHETRRSSPSRSASVLVTTFAASVAALAICAVALFLSGAREVLIATGCGLAALASVVIIRRFGLGALGITVFVVPVIGVAMLLFASYPIERGKSLLLAFAITSPESRTSVSERVLDDAPLLGTGAGTFAAVAPLYREMDNPRSGPVASTTAATWAIELGRPMLALIAAVTVGFAISLLRASLQRGRDSFYSAMGGSCLVTLLLLSFSNASLLGNVPGLIAAVVLGVSIAQSKSRTMQL